MAKKETAATTDLAIPENLKGSALTIQGYDDGGNAMSEVVRLQMHSGSNEDQARWPDAKAGDWIDALDGSSFGQSIRFVPLAAFMSWSRFEKGSPIPVYSTLNKGEVPPADLEWNGSEPPRCVEAFNFVGLVEGSPFVYRIMLKRTGYKVGETIKKLQQRRDMQQKGPGVYVLSSKPKQNKSSQTYRQVEVAPGGDMNADTLLLASKAIAAMATLTAKAKTATQEENTGGGEDEIPI